MKLKISSPYIYLSCALLFFSFQSSLEAGYQLKKGKLVDEKYVSAASVEDHYSKMLKCIDEKNWEEVALQSRIIIESFPDTNFASEAVFYQGISLYYLKEFDQADRRFNQYLQNKMQLQLKHFDEAIEYKFEIAEQFRMGAKRRAFGSEKMPKLFSANDQGVAVYDEIISFSPGKAIAARSSFSKGLLLGSMKKFKESIQAFEYVIKKFPTHDLVADSYLEICKTYELQGLKEFNNPDLVEMAHINLERFRAAFPDSPKFAEAQQTHQRMRENYANGLYEIGLFYEKKGKPQSAVLYYRHCANSFSETTAAIKSLKRITQLDIDSSAPAK